MCVGEDPQARGAWPDCGGLFQRLALLSPIRVHVDDLKHDRPHQHQKESARRVKDGTSVEAVWNRMVRCRGQASSIIWCSHSGLRRVLMLSVERISRRLCPSTRGACFAHLLSGRHGV